MAKRKKQALPEKSFPAPLMTPRGRRHYALIVIIAGLVVSHGYHSDVFQSLRGEVRDGAPSVTQWTDKLPSYR